MRTLLTGGVKSGKSSRALELAEEFPAERYFLATATAFDEEMAERIRRHQAERQGQFITIEESCDIHLQLRNAMVVDCIPMWLNNMFFTGREQEWEIVLDAFIAALPQDIIIVSNEINMGIIPADPLSRRYGMALGIANSRLAKACDHVELMVSGLSLRLK
ncbi:MAG: bifunctional adenosylcobinamide kinase/adenosylcobinamide-phosphate guanylyltransferase [Spirochaetes bacterium]|nr:bifunctional adenosylcobinamide kinase/adenosylcobinamide-phosphate guanylyltransferase [Spirochaetota bacterium]